MTSNLIFASEVIRSEVEYNQILNISKEIIDSEASSEYSLRIVRSNLVELRTELLSIEKKQLNIINNINATTITSEEQKKTKNFQENLPFIFLKFDFCEWDIDNGHLPLETLTFATPEFASNKIKFTFGFDSLTEVLFLSISLLSPDA